MQCESDLVKLFSFQIVSLATLECQSKSTLLTKTFGGVVIANITAWATSSGFRRGIYLTSSLLSDPCVVSISFSTRPGLIF